MKNLSKGLAIFFVMILVITGTVYAVSAPTFSPSIASGSVVNPGDQVKIVIQTADTYTALSECMYSWNGEAEKSVFDVSGKSASKGKVYKFTFTAEKFPTTAGTYTITLKATDQYSNTSTSSFSYIVKATTTPTPTPTPSVDTTAPAVTMSIADGSTVAGGTKLTMTVKDTENKVTSLKYNWYGVAETDVVPGIKSAANTITVNNLTVGSAAGKYVLFVTAVDAVGNKTQKTFTYTVNGPTATPTTTPVADTTAPTITMSKNSGSTLEGGTKISMTVKDTGSKIVSLKYNWVGAPEVNVIPGNKAPVNEILISNLTLGTTPGTYVLNVTAIDQAGNKAQKSFTYTVKAIVTPTPVADTTAPVITMSKASGSIVAGGTKLTMTVQDAESKITSLKYNWYGAAEVNVIPGNKSATNTITVNNLTVGSAAGTYVLNVTAVNAAGQKTVASFNYTVKGTTTNNYPTVDADPDGGDVEYGDKIVVTANDKDGEIVYVEYYWDNDKKDTTKRYTDKFTVKVPSEDGKHYLYVRAMDDDGNLCDYERFTYYVEENDYPGNSDIKGDLNTRIKALRVEIRNADDKLRFEPDEEILYYVDYYNGTSSKVKNAKIVVDLPTNLKGDKASDDGKISSKQITWSVGTLNAGENGRLTFKAHYTSSKVNEKIITVPAKIYSGSSVKDTSTVRNLIFCEDGSGTGSHKAYCVGYPDGTFLPEGRITRAELAAMICNIEGITSISRGQFTDANDHWAANYIQAVTDRGYIRPRTYNYFGADEDATRADLAYAIASILEVEDLEPIYVSATDTKYCDARCAVEQLLRLGIMDGYRDGTARPNNNITRAEAVTIINNYLFRGELYTRGYNYAYNFEHNYANGGSSFVLRFTDLSTNHWAYGQIMEATNNHRYERVMDGNEEML